MDAAERALLAETVLDALTRDPAAADQSLAALGWLEMLAAEPDVAIEVVFGALGRTNANAAVLDDAVAHALGIEPRADLAVLLPPFGTWAAPTTEGIATARITVASDLVVGDVVVPVECARTTPVHGIDPDARLHLARVAPAVAPAATDRWDRAVAVARRALAYQLTGASHTMLDLAREHAAARVQFGKPIGRFQAVRHRLAEALVAIEAAEAALDAAAVDPGPETALLAKAIAGNTARTVATHCQQVLAGIGFTTDHAFHRFLKRTMVLDGLFGSADDLTLDIGRRLLSTRTVPKLIEL
jgi:hypothetical protein